MSVDRLADTMTGIFCHVVITEATFGTTVYGTIVYEETRAKNIVKILCRPNLVERKIDQIEEFKLPEIFPIIAPPARNLRQTRQPPIL